MIIGFTGKKGSGKDTAGFHLVEKHGFTRVSFADKLKQSAAALFPGVIASDWDKWKNDPMKTIVVCDVEDEEPIASVTVREFLQLYGTEAHRNIFGTDFWVEQATKGLDPNGRYVFTDARFDNEAIAIHRLGGTVIEISRELGQTDSHSSEAGVSESLIDGRIRNIGTIDVLHSLLDTLVERTSLGG